MAQPFNRQQAAEDLLNRYPNVPGRQGPAIRTQWMNYLTDPVKGLNGQNTEEWAQRYLHPTGESTAAPLVKPAPPPPTAGPPTSDFLSQILEELQAQQTGDPSPLTRARHLQMLKGV